MTGYPVPPYDCNLWTITIIRIIPADRQQHFIWQTRVLKVNLKIADFFIGTCSGGLVALAVYQLLSGSSNMFLAMLLGGLIGMVLVLPLKFLLMPFFGAFEVVIPLGIIGMGVGMTAGMLSAIPNISGYTVIAWGDLAGLMVALIIYFSNQRLINE